MTDCSCGSDNHGATTDGQADRLPDSNPLVKAAKIAGQAKRSGSRTGVWKMKGRLAVKRVVEGIPVWGTEVDPGALAQIKRCATVFERVAMMADHHKGHGVPIGGVVAHPELVSPGAVGYDIACGNKAVRLDASESDVDVARVMNEIASTISFGVGRKNEERVDHDLFDDPAWSIKGGKGWQLAALRDMARSQLGTVGSGNHYVDLFADELGRLWVGVHFGSRGLGHKITTHFLTALGSSDSMDAAPEVVEAGSALGSDYLAAMHLAGRYAYAGRDWVCERVARIVGAAIVEEVHNHHNFTWREEHDGRALWVTRKGATPAGPGQRGFVGGSMGETSVILEGVDSPDSAPAMASTVHGAGRVMGRMEAKGKRDRHTGEWKRKPKVTEEAMLEWVNGAGVQLRGGGVDESPHCYKRLDEVLACHAESIRVIHTLRPLGVAMAGANEFDPYKD